MDMKKFSLAKHDPVIQKLIKETDHKLLARWAIDCLNRVLYIFEQRYPDEKVPYKAIEILENWMNDKISMWEARKYCWLVLDLARSLEKDDKVCCQILRATSHCLATCHVPTHAEGTAMYTISAIQHYNKGRKSVIKLMEDERKWQIEHLLKLKGSIQ